MSEQAKLDLILTELLNLKSELEIFKPDLRIEKEVIHFLAVDRRTFKKYLVDGRLIEGIHYFNENNKKVYVPEEIVKLKKGGCRPPITNPRAQAVLKEFGL